MEKKTVVQGGHGPVPMEENSRRYIDAKPVSVPMTAYYLRRLMSGELVEYVASKTQAPAPTTTATAPIVATPLPIKKAEEK